MSEFAAVMDLIGQLAWPVVILGLILLYRNDLRHAFKGLARRVHSATEVSIGGFFTLKAPPGGLEESSVAASEDDDNDLATPVTSKAYVAIAKQITAGEFVGRIHDYPYLKYRVAPPNESKAPQDWFKVRLFVSFDTEFGYRSRDVKHVTYFLHESFNPRVFRTDDIARQFEIWIGTADEFTVVAEIERNDGQKSYTSTYLAIPGSPSFES